MEKHDLEKQTALSKHPAEINSSNKELDQMTKHFKTEVDSHKKRFEMLREEMSLARHRYIESNLELGSIVHGLVFLIDRGSCRSVPN